MAKQFSQQFYASEAWKTVRKQILRRDMYTCRDCYGRASEVHHIVALTPDNIIDASIALNPDNLISLCRACHSKITKGSTGDLNEDYVFDEDGQVIPHAK